MSFDIAIPDEFLRSLTKKLDNNPQSGPQVGLVAKVRYKQKDCDKNRLQLVRQSMNLLHSDKLTHWIINCTILLGLLFSCWLRNLEIVRVTIKTINTSAS